MTRGHVAGKLLVGASIATLAVVFAPAVSWLLARWTTSVWQDAHGLLILPAALWFASYELRGFTGTPDDPSRWGFAFVGLGLALTIVDAGLQTMLLSAIGLVIVLPGLCLLMLGVKRTKAIAFPLAFVAFALPIPLALTESIHLKLRGIAAVGTQNLLSLLTIPNFVDGLTIHLPRGSIFVADSCSGFSTLYAAVAVACLTAHLTESTSRRVMVLAIAAPLAIAANILRVTLLGVLVQWKGTDILSTAWHPASGVMTFAIALPIIFWVGRPRQDAARPTAS